MRWKSVELHEQELYIIVDAAIPNKAQNTAIKLQIGASINDLMNRIADGWLDDMPDVSQAKAVVLPKTPEPPCATAKDSPLTIVP